MQEALGQWLQPAMAAGASDLHLEPGLPMAVRVRGQLRLVGEPVAAAALLRAARELLSDDQWQDFRRRQSYDLSRTLGGVRCRINVVRTARGVGLAVRLLTGFQANLRKLNLHPDLARLVQHQHGLVLVSGATGSGKSTTLAALIQEINLNETRHIIALESPIEYAIAPRKSLIRQREVGRDTPSFEQALLDALRQDPDVLVVGEMRDPETMRLTLAAAETGHLVLATLHSATCAEALARIVNAFAPEAQSNIAAQLADALVAVVCQRLTYRTPSDRLVPELEILTATTAARGAIRAAQWSKLQTVLETGGQDGCWTFGRYREWLERRADFFVPTERDAEPVPELPRPLPVEREAAAQLRDGAVDDIDDVVQVVRTPAAAPFPRRVEAPKVRDTARVLEIGDDDDDPLAILRELERRKR
ncbi:MAG: PilT/PilU family type 4a pilus ATPase [Deltaproteobacteria bacterium]|nr:PilT/PilU family type 4a pilus ATPase [Deltaproteobacteria bacterium]